MVCLKFTVIRPPAFTQKKSIFPRVIFERFMSFLKAVTILQNTLINYYFSYKSIVSITL